MDGHYSKTFIMYLKLYYFWILLCFIDLSIAVPVSLGLKYIYSIMICLTKCSRIAVLTEKLQHHLGMFQEYSHWGYTEFVDLGKVASLMFLSTLQRKFRPILSVTITDIYSISLF